MARRYPPEFRRRVLDLVASGRKVVDVARDLGVSGQTIYMMAARRRIAALEAELAATRRAGELLKGAVPPKGGSRPSR